MVTRLYEWDKNETWWNGIEVTDNKVINLVLRSLNNLIKVNWDNEVYTDLQLEDWIENTDALPIWVNVGRVLAADGRPVTGTLISWKTTSWDRVKFLYWDNWDIYMDNGTWIWNTSEWNLKVFYLSNISDIATAQAAYDRWSSWKVSILNYSGTLFFQLTHTWMTYASFACSRWSSWARSSVGYDSLNFTVASDVVTAITTWRVTIGDGIRYLDTDVNYSTVYMPQYDGSPATKKYVDSRVIIDSVAPDNPTEWQFWYDTTISVLNLYDGTQRQQI